MPKYFIHIGLPKTGTTTLQRRFFLSHPDIVAFAQPQHLNDPNTKEVLKTLSVPGCDRADRFSEITRHFPPDKPRVISDEALSFGEFMMRKRIYPNITTRHDTTAWRIRNVIGHSDVIITLRNQADFLASFKRQKMKSSTENDISMRCFIEYYQRNSDGRFLSALEYNNMYDAYVDVFGVDHVHVYIYEAWQDDFPALAENIANKIGVDSAKARELVIGQFDNVSKHTHSVFSLDEHIAIRERFAASNKRLFDRLCIEGTTFGYY